MGEYHAFFLQRPLGVIKITGETRLDLLDRMSTQLVRNLQPGEGAATVLTTDIGRIIDRLLVYARENELLVLTGAHNATNIIGYLMRFVFFNDDFHMQDLSGETAVFALYGASAAERLAAGGLAAADLPLHGWRSVEVGGHSATLHRTDPVAGDGYLLLVQAAEEAAVADWLTAAGFTTLDGAAFDRLRIEAGLPLLGRELTGDYIPLETGLWSDVSFSKGCYVGQEIIARMESRGKLAKRLVRLGVAGQVSAGAEIKAAGKGVGVVTSTAEGVALGYVKTAALEAQEPLTSEGTTLTVLS